ncbi:MAG: M67 family metallopeptidase [Acidimicrobiia bacterium]
MTRAASGGRFNLDAPTYEALIEHARSDAPFEVCGLLAGRDGVVTRHYLIPNAARSMTFYTMDPKAMLHAFNDMDDDDLDLLGIYHSHTHTEAFPSPTDVELAVYPDPAYLIVSLQDPGLPVIRAFGIRDGKVTEHVFTVGGAKVPAGNR